MDAAKTILVLEDDEAMRKLISSVLKSAGYHVLQAHNPTDAAAMFGSDLFAVDLLVADIFMPSMMGPDFARELLSMRPELKIVFITGTDQETIKATMNLAPHKQFLQKPFTPEQLREAVETALK